MEVSARSRRRSTRRTTSPSPRSMGYDRAWVYDTPQQSPDVWMTLALAAERTERIGLGPGVLVPSLRHPMVNAAATATLAALAPGRVAISFGTGFTGRRAMGYRAIPWSYMKELHPGVPRAAAGRGRRVGGRADADAAPRRAAPRPGPIDVPDPRRRARPEGRRGGRELGDGALRHAAARRSSSAYSWVPSSTGAPCSTRARPPTPTTPVWPRRARLGAGLPRRLRVRRPDAVRDLPGGTEWMDVVERRAADQRHLAVHVGHCVAPQRGRPGGVGRGRPRDAAAT